ncbi:methyltransferase domain-containing protein [Mucilaginibacter rubeus]|uniref:Methyltransferase domain-containing protein n=2 Tax=Mucilaginibacter rubeus TaxID=2027860 RepID=A0A364WTD9_9SPHI|nr:MULTISPECIES: methyltransferase domain-containing protein [Mucilaginibacter]QEM06137.1 methyltransferase domain-containing protein [Mucilaginibacter rubeus]QEM13654.1 methyltransferase domain-containing protein [Mucilaginibacter rubeus]QEM18717.1 methyltransferase domain-containing protein [Mucilaginibacter gossypii]QTE36289.1 methyltransferase domain-containing protein [Mucilaginibacter gossypii]QTE44742.1 class I SAM-dependent methyltransferase [Mucilaginibacter rubeus]
MNTNLGFEQNYIALRQIEKRIYSDIEVLLLPHIARDHVHYKEWKIRKQSCSLLISYLKRKRKPIKILEVGCGNGWLSAKLSEIGQSEVTGLDVNRVEINQAINVFSKKNLKFIYDRFPSEHLEGLKFDIIVFAASIQYFNCFSEVINEAFKCLTVRGEIHIVDTPFYKPDELADAANRSKKYFSGLGHAEMAHHYHYHSINDLLEFNHKILANPRKLFNRLFKKIKFPWVMIKC